MANSSPLAGLRAAHAVATGDSKVAIKNLINQHNDGVKTRVAAIQAKKKAHSAKQRGK
jgi:hypothetical protein